MKHLATILCAAAAALVVGCAVNKPVVYYQYKKGEPNFGAAQVQCRAQANREVVNRTTKRKTGEKCSVDSFGGTITCKDVYTTDFDYGYAARWDAAFNSCLSGLGWAPCNQGGLHLPECQ